MIRSESKNCLFTLAIILILLVVGAGLVVKQAIYVTHAHESFDNYYAFRGCTKLLTKTDDAATCTTGSGQTIKIVRVNNKWYLDGDLPVCWFGKKLCW